MRPKRPNHHEDPTQQPTAKKIRLNNQSEAEDLDLGTWLGHAEARCLRVGNLRARMELDKIRIIEIMARVKEYQPTVTVQHQPAESEDILEPGQPVVVAEHAVRSEDPPKAPRSDQHQQKKRAVPTPEYKLTSFAAWWRRVEKEGEKFYKEVRKNEDDRKIRQILPQV